MCTIPLMWLPAAPLYVNRYEVLAGDFGPDDVIAVPLLKVDRLIEVTPGAEEITLATHSRSGRASSVASRVTPEIVSQPASPAAEISDIAKSLRMMPNV